MNELYALLLAAEAASPAPDAAGSSIAQSLTFPIMMVLIFGVFYFFMLRPENKRKKETMKMRNELIVGDEVTTIGGIVGKVVSIKDESFVIESGPERTRVKLMRYAIASKGEKQPEN